MSANVKDCLQRFDIAEREKTNLDSYQQDLANFFIPRKAHITQSMNTGDPLAVQQLYEPHGMLALRIFVAGLNGYLTNSSSRWFSILPRNKALIDSQEAKVWFRDAENEMFFVLNKSNFEPQMNETYRNGGCFGTSVMMTERDNDTIVRYQTLAVEEAYISEDSKGVVQELYRKFKYTTMQAYERWGKNAGKGVVEAYEKKVYDKKFDFVHLIYPRAYYDKTKSDNLNMPYASVWINRAEKIVVQEGGFKTKPFNAVRFEKEPVSVYGFSPCMEALPAVKMLNAMAKTTLRAGQKAVDPPFLAPDDGFVTNPNFNPGKVNPYNSGFSKEMFQAIQTGSNPQMGIEILEYYKRQVSSLLYNDLFDTLGHLTKRMTVPEVQERISEKMILLGPVLGRITREMLDPIITRLFQILWDDGRFPPLPDSLQGQEFVIDYISPLAKAQKAGSINEMIQFMNETQMMAQAFPEVLDKIDADQSVEILADMHSVPPRVLKPQADVEAVRQQREQQQQEMMRQQQLNETAKAVSSLPQAKEGQNA